MGRLSKSLLSTFCNTQLFKWNYFRWFYDILRFDFDTKRTASSDRYVADVGCTSRNVYEAKKGSVSAHFAKARLHNVSTKQLNPAHINLDWRISKKSLYRSGKKSLHGYQEGRSDVICPSNIWWWRRRETGKGGNSPFYKVFFCLNAIEKHLNTLLGKVTQVKPGHENQPITEITEKHL